MIAAMEGEALLRDLVAARDGHFLLESGHHGPLWLDLDRLFLRPDRVEPLFDGLAELVRPHTVDVVCGPLTGGALVGYAVARRLGAAFVPAERAAHTPGALYSARYALPAAVASAVAGGRVAVVDDVVNAGSATRSTVAAVRAAGGVPVVVGALLRLGDAVATYASGEGLSLATTAAWPTVLWEPRSCPLCAAGEPLTDPAAEVSPRSRSAVAGPVTSREPGRETGHGRT